MNPHISLRNFANDVTCDHSCAKRAIAARKRDHTARLARGKLHVITCNPTRKKGNSGAQPRLHRPISARQTTCVTLKLKALKFKKKKINLACARSRRIFALSCTYKNVPQSRQTC